jgi:1,4-alpha-glucan branching enzyme
VSSSPRGRDRGELAILLHSHMPYVEGFGTWPFGEEWLFEAIATAYLPLLELCERWRRQGETGVITFGVTPVLADQLVLGEVGERFLSFVREVRAETHRLDTEHLERAGQHEAAQALRLSAHEYERAAEAFERLGGDLVGSLGRRRDAGVIELWTSAATHAVLPLLATEAGVRLQLQTGVDSHRARFGRWSGGFWLPECAFRAGIDEQLAQAGARAFCVYLPDPDEADALVPVAAAGAVAIPIDWPTIAHVWDPHGYPADSLYRDYHAHTLNGLRPYANGGGPYVAEAALARVREHACDFVARAAARLDRHRARRGRPGLLVCALDTELLGHWWHEGPAWLAAVVEEARSVGVALCTLPEALERHPPREAELAETSWGEGKDLTTWDSPAVAELVWPARRAELALSRAITREAVESAPNACRRLARELLALQSSDWAFMATRRLAADYPQRRVRAHAAEFERALAALPPYLKDSRNMPAPAEPDRIDPKLRGVAPALRLSTLLEPPSAWRRAPLFEAVGG